MSSSRFVLPNVPTLKTTSEMISSSHSSAILFFFVSFIYFLYNNTSISSCNQEIMFSMYLHCFLWLVIYLRIFRVREKLSLILLEVFRASYKAPYFSKNYSYRRSSTEISSKIVKWKYFDKITCIIF